MAPFQSLQPGASTTLAELGKANPKGLVVWAAVVDYNSARQTKGEDLMMSMRLADSSIDCGEEKGINFLLFYPDRRSFPPVVVGDAVRLRRFTANTHNGATQLMTKKEGKERSVVTSVDIVRRGESAVSWSTPVPGSEGPAAPAAMTKEEVEKAHALHSLVNGILIQTAERDWGFMRSVRHPADSCIDCIVRKVFAQENTGEYAGAFVDEADQQLILLKAFGPAAGTLLDTPVNSWIAVKRAQLSDSMDGRLLVCGRYSSITSVYDDHPLVTRAKKEYGGQGQGQVRAAEARAPVTRAPPLQRPKSSGRPQFASFSAPTAPARTVVSSTVHEGVQASTIADITAGPAPGHFRCTARVRAAGPTQEYLAIQPFCRKCRSASDVKIEEGPQQLFCQACNAMADTVFKLTIVLEDDTGVLETNLFADEAATFLGVEAADYFTSAVTRVKFNAAMQKLQDPASWLDCCVMAYTAVDTSSPTRAPQRRYRIFATRFTG